MVPRAVTDYRGSFFPTGFWGNALPPGQCPKGEVAAQFGNLYRSCRSADKAWLLPLPFVRNWVAAVLAALGLAGVLPCPMAVIGSTLVHFVAFGVVLIVAPRRSGIENGALAVACLCSAAACIVQLAPVRDAAGSDVVGYVTAGSSLLLSLFSIAFTVLAFQERKWKVAQLKARAAEARHDAAVPLLAVPDATAAVDAGHDDESQSSPQRGAIQKTQPRERREKNPLAQQ